MEEKQFEIKEKLIEEVKKLAEDENAINLLQQANALKKKWRSREDEESFYEQELKEEFNKYLDIIYSKVGEVSVSAKEAKNKVIEKAKELLNKENFKDANKAMNELMNEWKASGRCATKEEDDELWNEFKAIKDEFYEKKNAFFENLRASYEENKNKKQELINKATEANKLDNIKELSSKMNELMEEWKKTGSAGRKDDNDLWDAFKEQRKAFFKKKDEYFDSMKEEFAKRAEAKKEIIAQAKRYLAISDFTKEEVEAVKNLRQEYKKIGNAGKDNENALWEEFNRIINKYFENKKFYD